jgi:CTP:molybdopterin cytidylyltransferase MocA
MGASLRAGLEAVERSSADAALVHLVDVPDIGAEIVSRIAEVATGPHSLARAVFRGAPGHPVLLGSDHWNGIRQSLVGDRGARDYLAAHGAVLVECGDLASGRDLDEPPEVDQDA